MTPSDIVRNVAEGMMGLYENLYLDGDRDEPISLDEFKKEVYDAMMCDRIYLYDDGTEWEMPTPLECRFLGKSGIQAIAEEVYKTY